MTDRNPIGRFNIKQWTHVDNDLVPAGPSKLGSRHKWNRVLTHKFMQKGVVRNTSARFYQILSNNLGLENDDEWYVERPLGAGTYGCVALFQKRDQQGSILDHVVLKTAEKKSSQFATQYRPDLSKEAFIQYQANDLDCEGLLYLRNYKDFDHANEWRYYFEYCPFGDLERLRLRYKAWGYHLPEAFLWYVFGWLIAGCTVMDWGPFRRIVKYSRNGSTMFPPIPHGYLLHQDIKPQNSHSLYRTTKCRTSAPIFRLCGPKLADFGLSHLTHLKDDDNLPRNLQMGSPYWKPPEIRYVREWNRAESPGPFQTQDSSMSTDFIDYSAPLPRFRKGQYRIGSEANLWAIGSVMYQLLTLDEPDVLHDAVTPLLKDNKRRPLDGNIIPPIVTHHDPGDGYSHSLLQIVRQCVNFYPEKRPSYEFLNAETNKTLLEIASQQTRDFGTDSAAIDALNKVWYKENEIHNLPPGPIQFDCNSKFWRRYFEYENPMYTDPDWGPCIPHQQRPQTPFPTTPSRLQNTSLLKKRRSRSCGLSPQKPVKAVKLAHNRPQLVAPNASPMRPVTTYVAKPGRGQNQQNLKPSPGKMAKPVAGQTQGVAHPNSSPSPQPGPQPSLMSGIQYDIGPGTLYDSYGNEVDSQGNVIESESLDLALRARRRP